VGIKPGTSNRKGKIMEGKKVWPQERAMSRHGLYIIRVASQGHTHYDLKDYKSASLGHEDDFFSLFYSEINTLSAAVSIAETFEKEYCALPAPERAESIKLARQEWRKLEGLRPTPW
jgi:hypothetical protein